MTPDLPRAKRFYARRSLRILPLYYVTFFGFLLLAHVLPLGADRDSRIASWNRTQAFVASLVSQF